MHLGDEEWAQIDLLRFGLWGSLALVSVDFLIHPFEVVRTKLQVDKGRSTLWRSMLRAFRDTYRSDGFRGLYRGFWLSTLGGLPSMGAYFLGYSWAKQTFALMNRAGGTGTASTQTYLPDAAVYLAAGFFADVVAAPLWTPVDVITQRMQLSGPGTLRYRSTSHAVQHILKHEGVRGLFRGLGSTIVAFGPASALWFAAQEVCKEQLMAWRGNRNTNGAATTSASEAALKNEVEQKVKDKEEEEEEAEEEPMWVSALSGAVAGSLTAVLTNPLDIAKTRLQTQHSFLLAYEAAAERSRRERAEKAVAVRQARKEQFFRSVKLLRDARLAAAQATAAALAKQTAAATPSQLQAASAVAAAVKPSAAVRADMPAPAAAAAAGVPPQAEAGPRSQPATATASLSHSAQAHARAQRDLLKAVVASSAQTATTPGSAAASAASEQVKAALDLHAAAAGAREEQALTEALRASTSASASNSGSSSAAARASASGRSGSPGRKHAPHAASEVSGAARMAGKPSSSSATASASAAGEGTGTGTASRPTGRLRLGLKPPSFAMPRWGLVPYQMTLSASSAVMEQASATFAAVARAWETNRLGRRVRRDPVPPTPTQAKDSVKAPGAAAAPSSVPQAAPRASAAAAAASSAAAGSVLSPLQADSLRVPGVSAAGKLRFEQTVAARVARRASITAAASRAASSATGAPPLLQPNMLAMLRHMWASEGAAALTRGLLPRILTAGPASALTFVCFEQVKRLSRKTPQEMAQDALRFGPRNGAADDA